MIIKKETRKFVDPSTNKETEYVCMYVEIPDYKGRVNKVVIKPTNALDKRLLLDYIDDSKYLDSLVKDVK